MRNGDLNRGVCWARRAMTAVVALMFALRFALALQGVAQLEALC